jgi:hypothetical protein
MMTRPDEGVPPVSEERREKVTGSGSLLDGPRADSEAGPDGFPGALFLIFISFTSFSFSVSLISFIAFAKMLQIKPNKFLMPSNIHSSVLNY